MIMFFENPALILTMQFLTKKQNISNQLSGNGRGSFALKLVLGGDFYTRSAY